MFAVKASPALASEDSSAADSMVVEEVRRGNRQAYAQLVDRYEKKLLRTVHRLVGSKETAEDLVQESFLRAYDRLPGFDSSRRFGPWLFQIATNAAIDWLRKHRRRKVQSLQDLTNQNNEWDFADPEQRAKRDTAQQVHHVLEQLPIEDRTVLILRDLEGFATSEVAAIIGKREPTVRWRLAKAREAFRALWDNLESK